MNIEMALKSKTHILDLDNVKLSLGIFFTGLFNGELITPAFSIYIYFDQKHTPKKAANLMFRLILPAAKVPWWFLGVQFSMLVG